MRATKRTVSHSCCRYFYKHTGRSNTTLSSDSITRVKTQHGTWRHRSAPAPPVLARWSLPCRWPPATLRSDPLSIDHSWTKVWEWLPARTHISSHWQLRMSCVQPPADGAKTRDKRGAHQVLLQDRLVCDLCCCFETPVETNPVYFENCLELNPEPSYDEVPVLTANITLSNHSTSPLP